VCRSLSLVLNVLFSMGNRTFMFVLLGRNCGFGRAVSRVTLKMVDVTEHVSVLIALLEASVLGTGVEG
jgi:hypothetical protein